jgi:radical SAM protein with 4Fe4S-binding SPASM domain
MCYLGPDWGKGRKKDELTTEEVFGLLDQLHAAGTFELLITGGEVCLRKDLVQIIDYAGSKSMLLTIKTNGTMVNGEHVAAFSRNPVKSIDMSLLGATAETHDGVTKIPRSFERTCRTIEMLRGAELPVKLNFTATKLNFREVVAARKLAEAHGCDFEWSSQVQPRDDRSVIPLTLRVGGEELMELKQMQVADVIEEGGQWEPPGYTNSGWFCGAGRFSFNITPYGDVQPCILMRMDCGNIREKSFLHIWETAPELQRLRSLRIAEVYGCNACAVRDYCTACPGLFFMEMGDVTVPSPHACQEAEMKHQAATGVFKPAGSRDKAGNFPRPANAIFGGAGHQPIPLEIRRPGHG